MREFRVPRGRHKVRMVLGEAEVKEKIGVSRKSARTFSWDVGSGGWTEQ